MRWHLRGDHRENQCSDCCSVLPGTRRKTQTLKMIAVRFPANGSTPNSIQFLWAQQYDRAECVKDATARRRRLLRMRYSSWEHGGLGWFRLRTGRRWSAVRAGDPVSPAFSMLDQRVTLLDDSLFVASATRKKELVQRFGVMGPRWSIW